MNKRILLDSWDGTVFVIPQIKTVSLENELGAWEVRIDGRLYFSIGSERKAEEAFDEVINAIKEFYEE